MKTLVTFFSIQKDGNLYYENEDKIYPLKKNLVGNKLSFAIADGATEGYLSKLWASILVRTYVKSQFLNSPISLEEYIDLSINIWNKRLKQYLKRRENNNKPIYWFEEIALQKGAFSTILGLTLHDEEDIKSKYWVSIAIGDSCLFQIRDDKLINCFPIDKSHLLNNRPTLLASNMLYNNKIVDYLHFQRSEYQNGDHFYLMTDALSQWFLQEYETDSLPWNVLNDFSVDNKKLFKKWIHKLRTEKAIRNDDVSMIHFHLIE